MEAVNLYIVIPCYNEEEVLPETARRILDLMNRMKQYGLINGKSRNALLTTAQRTGHGK